MADACTNERRSRVQQGGKTEREISSGVVRRAGLAVPGAADPRQSIEGGRNARQVLERRLHVGGRARRDLERERIEADLARAHGARLHELARREHPGPVLELRRLFHSYAEVALARNITNDLRGSYSDPGRPIAPPVEPDERRIHHAYSVGRSAIRRRGIVEGHDHARHRPIWRPRILDDRSIEAALAGDRHVDVLAVEIYAERALHGEWKAGDRLVEFPAGGLDVQNTLH